VNRPFLDTPVNGLFPGSALDTLVVVLRFRCESSYDQQQLREQAENGTSRRVGELMGVSTREEEHRMGTRTSDPHLDGWEGYMHMERIQLAERA
jgi:hypothetical protein